jgi:protein-S-isoprenylcysteine O-methyltransferase Ste14
MSLLPELVLAALTIGIAAGSVWLVMSAIQTLGKQWSFAARIVEEHTLITEGPYKFVRHPIYAGMFGMMLATGLAISHWVALIPAVLIFWLGTRLRIASEEKLLRETFGDQYMQYALRVPALIPRLLPRSAQKSAG